MGRSSGNLFIRVGMSGTAFIARVLFRQPFPVVSGVQHHDHIEDIVLQHFPGLLGLTVIHLLLPHIN